MKKEIKIALVIDDYKLKNKEEWWAKSLKTQPHIEKNYDFVKEEIGPGITKNTINLYRHYKLKAGK
jgi:hypothetical protein